LTVIRSAVAVSTDPRGSRSSTVDDCLTIASARFRGFRSCDRDHHLFRCGSVAFRNLVALRIRFGAPDVNGFRLNFDPLLCTARRCRPPPSSTAIHSVVHPLYTDRGPGRCVRPGPRIVVEMAGIEPASEKFAPRYATSLVGLTRVLARPPSHPTEPGGVPVDCLSPPLSTSRERQAGCMIPDPDTPA
jgi:hypothetical protein